MIVETRTEERGGAGVSRDWGGREDGEPSRGNEFVKELEEPDRPRMPERTRELRSLEDDVNMLLCWVVAPEVRELDEAVDTAPTGDDPGIERRIFFTRYTKQNKLVD